MWEFISIALFVSQALGMGLFVGFVALRMRLTATGPRSLAMVGLVVAPLGVLASLSPALGGSWVVGGLGFAAMVGWWLAVLVYHMSSAKVRHQPLVLTAKL